jgi:hypothetical protein
LFELENDKEKVRQNSMVSNGDYVNNNDKASSLSPPPFQLKNDSPIQMYSIVKPGQQKPDYFQGLNRPLRVSDDGEMAVAHINGVPSDTKDFQHFYATPTIIQNSKQVMAQIGSGFTFTQGGQTMIGKAPGEKNAATKTLYQVQVTNHDLARHGKGDYAFNACSANMQNVLGILRLVEAKSAEDKANKMYDERKVVRDVILKLEGSLDHDKKAINTKHDLGLALAEANKVITGITAETEARNAVKKLSKSVLALKAEQYGLNEHALPEVGEGYAIRQGGKGGVGGYGHYAAVVAKSGSDRVTLENDVSQKAHQEGHKVGQINPDWYFRMFGSVKKKGLIKNDQTFWGEAKKYEKDDFGDKPFVARIGSAPKQ